MNQENVAPTSGIFRPPRALSRKTAEPILYLADSMAKADEEVVPREMRMIDLVADAVGLPTFRHQPWFREMTEAAALQRLNTDLAKKATLVVLSLVLKADAKRRPEELAYFSKVRGQLGAPPITVPVDIEAHKELALQYFQD